MTYGAKFDIEFFTVSEGSLLPGKRCFFDLYLCERRASEDDGDNNPKKNRELFHELVPPIAVTQVADRQGLPYRYLPVLYGPVRERGQFVLVLKQALS
jgi:hypothetical protein